MIRVSYKLLLFFVILPFVLASCNNIPDQHWINAVPGNSPGVMLYHDNPTVNEVVGSEYMTFVQELTNSNIPVAAQLEDVPETTLNLKAVAAIPSRYDTWRPLWVGESSSGFLSAIAPEFYQEFAENQYEFGDINIHILHTSFGELYAAQLRNWVVFSESSYAVEEAVRSYLGKRATFDYEDAELAGNDFLLNTPVFDSWISQLGAVRYRPMITGIFEGTSPTLLRRTSGGAESIEHRLEGSISTTNPASELVSTATHEPQELILDRYISQEASIFAITNNQPQQSIPPDFEPFSELDSLLIEEPDIYSDISATLNPQAAFVAFADPEEETSGEHLYIRHLQNSEQAHQIFSELARDGYVRRDDEVFYVQSEILGELIGGPLSNFDDFYFNTTWEGAIIAQRSGLIERVRTDRSQRRVMYYDDTYAEIRDQHPDAMSAFVFTRNQGLYDYLHPLLNPNHRFGAITSRSDLMALSVVSRTIDEELDILLDTYRVEESDEPYRERWVYPIDNVNLTGDPIVANTGRGSRDEVFIATDGGRVYGLASDGTTIFNASTGGDTPIGSPIVYDWYGNNQQMVLLGAGNKIYGWNQDGISLPNFPIELGEELSAPINVGDVARDGMNELIAATEDRQLHVLDGRGRNIDGWPQSTNASIETRPVLHEVGGQWSVWAFAGNGAHAWRTYGDRREGFPVFADAPFQGKPVFHNENLLATGADGYLYAMGAEAFFDEDYVADTPDDMDRAEEEEEALVIQRLEVANTSLVGDAQIRRLQLRSQEDQNEEHNETMVVVGAANGSVFVYNTDGVLRFTESMGQPASADHSPFLYDLGDTGSEDLVMLSQAGRLYAWDLMRNQRITQIPTAGMQRLLLTDLYGDGRTELIAETSSGLRAWTLSRITEDPS